MSQTQKIYNEITKVKKETGLNGKKLVSYLNDHNIRTVTGKQWTLQGVHNFISKVNRANKTAPKAATKGNVQTAVSPAFRQSEEWEAIVNAVMSTNLASQMKFKAVQAIVSKY